MPFSPNGVFTPAIVFTDGTEATAEDQNTQDQDIAAGLTVCATLAGLGTATANWSMGGFKLTGLGLGSASGDSINFSQLTGANPAGQIILFAGASLPAGFLYCDGSAVSRTTYANLFAAVGTTWGSGDGSTTFNLPDFRGRLAAGADNMNGTAANRLSGYDLGVTGGAQAIALSAAQLPVSAYADSGHVHGIADPGHVHEFNAAVQAGSNDYGLYTVSGAFSPMIVGTEDTTLVGTGISISTARANITNSGGGGSHSNVQPTAALNILIRY